ncbi:hypothetical protein N9391_01110 [Gammaproteobacteria bacterium]|nr:hypothetical protein [Gammaproteobacteria bacterium]
MTAKTYLIRWNAGYGDIHDVVHAKDLATAENWAYESWKDEVESQGDYGAELATRENLEEAGFDPDEYLIEECE